MGNKPLEAAHPVPKLQAGGTAPKLRAAEITAPKPKVAEKALRETPGKEISLSRSKKMDAPGQGVTTPNATAQQNALKLPYRFKPQQYFDSPQRAVQPTTAPKPRVQQVENVGSEGKVTPSKMRPDMGEYRHTKGHHVHAKKAFEGHVNYDPKKGFSISEESMEAFGARHADITTTQRRLFSELAKSGRPNTLKEHTRIAIEALVENNIPLEQARFMVAQSLRNLKNQDVRQPMNIPWKK